MWARKLILLILFVFSINYPVFSQETFTLTTYYPAPFGVYQELRAKRMAIGQNFHTSEYGWTSANTYHFGDTTSLAIEDDVLIGDSPAEALRIRRGSDYFGSGGDYEAMIIEKTDDDPIPEGGLVFGFATSNAIDTPSGDPGWAVNHRGILRLRVANNGKPRIGIGHNILNPVVALDIEGGVKIRNVHRTCNEDVAGTLRYNGGYIEYCNGTDWNNLSSGLAAVGAYTGNDNSNRLISTGFRPRTVLITMEDDLQITKTETMNNWRAFQQGAGNTGEGKAHFEDSTKLANSGFKVKGWANKNGNTYHYTAWP